MLIHSDWHMHSEASYDSQLPLAEIEEKAHEYGFEKIGITDHANFNDRKFLTDLENSAKSVKELKKTNPNVVLGVELTPIEKPEFDYIQIHGVRDGYEAPSAPLPYDIELAQTKEQLIALGVQYAVGAAHWRVDSPNARILPHDLEAEIREWYRQQIWLACDNRVTILGHPWCNVNWYDDFSVIPHSMNLEIAAALKEHGKYMECNSCFFRSSRTTETFRRQYAEFLREVHELGIPITYGSDSHNAYAPYHADTEMYLLAAGFRDGDIVGLQEEALWK